MTFDKIWEQLVGKQPGLTNPDATCEFTSANLKRLLEQVYQHGRKQEKLISDTKETISKIRGERNPLGSFSDLFGG